MSFAATVDTLSRSDAFPAASAVGPGTPALVPFEELYDAHFDFVWRSVRRLGVPAASMEDAAQDVFVVVHRKIGEFQGRSSLKTWIFGIVVFVARAYRRRRSVDVADADPDALADAAHPSPQAQAEAAEALRALQEVLDELSDERREVFVLIELEEMTAPEAAEALGVKLNTVYSRFRAARQDVDAAVARRAAREGWRSR